MQLNSLSAECYMNHAVLQNDVSKCWTGRLYPFQIE